MQVILFIAFGSALGGTFRFLLNLFISERASSSFPWGIFIINVIGCFLAGFLFTITDVGGKIFLPPAIRQGLLIGFLGGFTTFSSFSYETLTLINNGQYLLATSNCLFSVVTCLFATFTGIIIANNFNCS
jgi:fluoride exporter